MTIELLVLYNIIGRFHRLKLISKLTGSSMTFYHQNKRKAINRILIVWGLFRDDIVLVDGSRNGRGRALK